MALVHQVIAAILLLAQTFIAPLAALETHNEAAVADAPLVSTSEILNNLYLVRSPSVVNQNGLHLFISGLPQSTDAPGRIYESDYVTSAAFENGSGSGEWQSPHPVFAIPGYRLSDPSVIPDPMDPQGSLLMYYSSISDTDAAASSTASTNNHVGLARSSDGGQTWTDQGVVIGQQNGIDERGGWDPSAVLVGNEIWLYYSVNYPGYMNRYRTRFDQTGKNLLGTDRMVATDNGTTTPLLGFGVDVSIQNGQYVMLFNKDFSGIWRYVSDDGIHWKTAQGDVNPIVQAKDDSIISAPYTHTETTVSEGSTYSTYNLYFVGGSKAAGRFTRVYETSLPATQVSASTASSQQFTPGSNSDASQSGGGSLGAAALVGVLGIAAIVGLSLLAGGTVAATAVSTVSSAATPVSFGGRIVALLPCMSALGPSIWVQLAPSSPLYPPYEYIWTPATLLSITPPVPSIPPSHPGQDILGRFDIPYFCVTVAPPFFYYGLRMQTEGVSPI